MIIEETDIITYKYKSVVAWWQGCNSTVKKRVEIIDVVEISDSDSRTKLAVLFQFNIE